MSVANASAMPPAISEIFEILRQDTIMLHASWDTFHELFGTERSAGIVSDVAPVGFAMVRNALGHEIIMGVSRITDPKTTGRVRRRTKTLPSSN
jgi:AbiU2